MRDSYRDLALLVAGGAFSQVLHHARGTNLTLFFPHEPRVIIESQSAMVRVAYGSLETPARMFILEARLMLLPLDEPTWSIQLVLVSSAPGDVEHVVTFREGLPQVGEFVLISSELRRE